MWIWDPAKRVFFEVGNKVATGRWSTDPVSRRNSEIQVFQKSFHFDGGNRWMKKCRFRKTEPSSHWLMLLLLWTLSGGLGNLQDPNAGDLWCPESSLCFGGLGPPGFQRFGSRREHHYNTALSSEPWCWMLWICPYQPVNQSCHVGHSAALWSTRSFQCQRTWAMPVSPLPGWRGRHELSTAQCSLGLLELGNLEQAALFL